MNKLAIPFLAIAVLLPSCATFDDGRVADYNHDGVVSDAEYKQYNKQASVQATNVEVETMKRRNAVNTLGDVNESIWTVRSMGRGLGIR